MNTAYMKLAVAKKLVALLDTPGDWISRMQRALDEWACSAYTPHLPSFTEEALEDFINRAPSGFYKSEARVQLIRMRARQP